MFAALLVFALLAMSAGASACERGNDSSPCCPCCPASPSTPQGMPGAGHAMDHVRVREATQTLSNVAMPGETNLPLLCAGALCKRAPVLSDSVLTAHARSIESRIRPAGSLFESPRPPVHPRSPAAGRPRLASSAVAGLSVCL